MRSWSPLKRSKDKSDKVKKKLDKQSIFSYKLRKTLTVDKFVQLSQNTSERRKAWMLKTGQKQEKSMITEYVLCKNKLNQWQRYTVFVKHLKLLTPLAIQYNFILIKFDYCYDICITVFIISQLLWFYTLLFCWVISLPRWNTILHFCPSNLILHSSTHQVSLFFKFFFIHSLAFFAPFFPNVFYRVKSYLKQSWVYKRIFSIFFCEV